jgi:hypothetical protein
VTGLFEYWVVPGGSVGCLQFQCSPIRTHGGGSTARKCHLLCYYLMKAR